MYANVAGILIVFATYSSREKLAENWLREMRISQCDVCRVVIVNLNQFSDTIDHFKS